MFFFAGVDSTASTIAYTFHMLAKHAEVLGELRDEHDRIFGKNADAGTHLREQPALLSSGVRLTQLVAQCIPLRLFDSQTLPASFISACAQLTHIDLDVRCDAPDGSDCEATLRAFLVSLTNLRDLSLRFNPRYRQPRVVGLGTLPWTYHVSAPRGLLCDVFPRTRTWLHLKTLSVTYVTATTDDLVTLIRDHGQTVQGLRLAHIRLLKPIGGRIGWSVPEWRRVFAELAGIENLETASIRQWIRPMFIDKRTWPVYTAQRKVEVATNLTKYLAYDGKATIDRGM